jgi:hypothetical protein
MNIQNNVENGIVVRVCCFASRGIKSYFYFEENNLIENAYSFS